MKIAYATLLVFVLLTGYLTLREHTAAVTRLHRDNERVNLTLESIDRRLESINKAMQVVPTPMPASERPSKEPKIANEMPVRRPEIIE